MRDKEKFIALIHSNLKRHYYTEIMQWVVDAFKDWDNESPNLGECDYCQNAIRICAETKTLKTAGQASFWTCTRPRGHAWPHVACSGSEHDLAAWE